MKEKTEKRIDYLKTEKLVETKLHLELDKRNTYPGVLIRKYSRYFIN